MKNLIIRTYDIFKHNDPQSFDNFLKCKRIAKRCHIGSSANPELEKAMRICTNSIWGGTQARSDYSFEYGKDIYLCLCGYKSDLIKYYLRTFFVRNESFKSAAKRLWDIATTH